MQDESLHDTLSTLIAESDSIAVGGGTPPPEVKESAEPSIRDILKQEAQAQDAEATEKAAAKEAAKEPAKAPEKAEPAKVKAKEEAPAKAEAEADSDTAEVQEEIEAEKPDEAGAKEPAKAAQSEGKADRIPSRLLPKEREVWANTPNPVKAAWERMEREHAEFTETAKQSTEFYEGLREYDGMARAANTTVKDALDRYVAADKMLAQDFGRGLAHIAQSHGKNPVEAVAQFMRAAGVQPQQLGAYLQGQPAQPQQQQQRPVDPAAQAALQKVQQLEQVIEQQRQAQLQQKEQAEIEAARREVVEPIRAMFPRFDELRSHIAHFYNSDIIPPSLSPVERLEVACDMAERINPSPVATSPILAEPAGKPPASDAGKKSVRGAPASGQSRDADFDDETDLVTLIRREAKKLTA